MPTAHDPYTRGHPPSMHICSCVHTYVVISFSTESVFVCPVLLGSAPRVVLLCCTALYPSALFVGRLFQWHLFFLGRARQASYPLTPPPMTTCKYRYKAHATAPTEVLRHRHVNVNTQVNSIQINLHQAPPLLAPQQQWDTSGSGYKAEDRVRRRAGGAHPR